MCFFFIYFLGGGGLSACCDLSCFFVFGMHVVRVGFCSKKKSFFDIYNHFQTFFFLLMVLGGGGYEN